MEALQPVGRRTVVAWGANRLLHSSSPCHRKKGARDGLLGEVSGLAAKLCCWLHVAGLGPGRAFAAKVKQQGLWEADMHWLAELLTYATEQQCVPAGKTLSFRITQGGNFAGRLWTSSRRKILDMWNQDHVELPAG